MKLGFFTVFKREGKYYIKKNLNPYLYFFFGVILQYSTLFYVAA